MSRTLDEHALEHLQVGFDVVLLLEREPGGQDGAGELFGLADTDAVAVQLGAAAAGGSEQLVTDGIVDNGLFGLAPTRRAMETAKCGTPLTRLVVPSSGSMIHW